MSPCAHHKMRHPNLPSSPKSESSPLSSPHLSKPISTTSDVSKMPLQSKSHPSQSPAKPAPKSPSKSPMISPTKDKSTAMISSSSKRLSKHQLSELEQTFQRFDANGDGKISARELGAVLRALGNVTSEEEARRIMRDIDRDGDGYINLTEFIYLNTNAVGLQKGETANVEDLRNAFQVFDTDRDGFITREELHRVLTNLGDKCTVDDCYKMIRGVDGNGDGLVDFEEFKAMMMKPLK